MVYEGGQSGGLGLLFCAVVSFSHFTGIPVYMFLDISLL